MRPDMLLPGLMAFGLVFFVLTLGGCAAPSAPVPSESAAAPPRPVHRASDLLGDSPADLVTLLGPPSLRHRDGPAEVWLYAAEGCRLDVVLYPPASDTGGLVRVSLAEVRGSHPIGTHLLQLPPAEEGVCLSRLRTAMAPVPGEFAAQGH